MPQENTRRRDVLTAIERIQSIAGLTAQHDGHYDYELDLEVAVYGRNYNGKKVGPYVRLLTYAPGEVIVTEGEWGGNSFYIVVEGQAEVFIKKGKTRIGEVPPGVQFGEMSVLAGMPRTATVRAPEASAVQVLQIQRPALRLLRKLPQFGQVIDKTYRRNGRVTTLQRLGAAVKLDAETIKKLEPISQFRVYSKNHVLFRAGAPVRRIYLLRAGWVRLAKGLGTEPLGAADPDARPGWNETAEESFLGPGHCFGVEGLTRNSNWEQTCVLLGRTEILEISISLLRESPELREAVRKALEPLAAPTAAAERAPLPIAKAQNDLIATGLVDGTNLLVMDMDLCVRCGNCSLACHHVHGQSRLVRHGIHITRPTKPKRNASFQSALVPAVCLHCQDPECLTGCPTGAIGRFPGGQVDIDKNTCIGCADCATQCPYNAITMVPRAAAQRQDAAPRSWWRQLLRLELETLPPAVEQTEDLIAVKCNSCANTGLNPPGTKVPAYSCEENCPTGALLRVDPRSYFAEIKNIEGVIFKDATHAVARHTSHKDNGKRLLHLLGVVMTLVLTALTVIGLTRYGLETPLAGSWLNLRWLTGLVGLAGIILVMAYPVRRQIYKRRAGPLRYWLLTHTYAGVIAGILLLLHGGTRSGGVLTTALMVSFDLVILTGLLGILLYFCAPRLLTKIEGQPLLIEDLTARRAELNEEISEMLTAVSPATRALLEKRVIPRFLSLRYLLRQYLKRDTLAQMLAAAQAEFQAVSLPAAEQQSFFKATEAAATLRRVEALIYLHRALKAWLAPHVLVTSLMLALLLVHIIQVLYFAAR